MGNPVAVVVGLLRNPEGKYWVGQRPVTARYPGKWEFPGGKLEPGESPQEGLARELYEELSIVADIGPMVFEQLAEYPDGGTFTVQFFLVELWEGTPSGILFADCAWVDPVELQKLDLLEGSRPICTLLQKFV